jgi:hypothetical protein
MSSVVSRYCEKSGYVDWWKMSERMDENVGTSVGVGKKRHTSYVSTPQFQVKLYVKLNGPPLDD